MDVTFYIPIVRFFPPNLKIEAGTCNWGDMLSEEYRHLYQRCVSSFFGILITVKSGATSYRDLDTVNSIHPSAACCALGLIFDDLEWISLFN